MNVLWDITLVKLVTDSILILLVWMCWHKAVNVLWDIALVKLAADREPSSVLQGSWSNASKKQREKLLELIRRLAEDDKEGVMAHKVGLALCLLVWSVVCTFDLLFACLIWDYISHDVLSFAGVDVGTSHMWTAVARAHDPLWRFCHMASHTDVKWDQ